MSKRSDTNNDIEANVSGDNVPGTGLTGFPGTYAGVLRGVYGTGIWENRPVCVPGSSFSPFLNDGIPV